MRISTSMILKLSVVFALIAWLPAVAAAANEDRVTALEQRVQELEALVAELRAADAAPEDRLTEIERRIALIATELEDLKLGEAAVVADTSVAGFGPAASKVYRKDEGLSIGGYGEFLYENYASTRENGSDAGAGDRFDALRAIVYFGYKFSDKWLLNTEIEVEHASTGSGGEVSLEFAYLDYLYRPELGFRGGLLLMPMGFVNELHEPTTFLGAARPQTERSIIPTTWRENGAGIFGSAGGFDYRSYLVTGMRADGFSAAGLRGGRQKGAKAKADDFALVARADYTAIPGFLAGVSAYVGDSGQGLESTSGSGLAVRTTIVEGHAEWRHRGLELRGLWTRASLDDVAELNDALRLVGADSVGQTLEGYYLQAGYDLLSASGSRQALIPFVRYEELDTQRSVPVGWSANPANDRKIFTLGLSYRPLDQIVIKADYQINSNGADTGLDQFNVALGYIF